MRATRELHGARAPVWDVPPATLRETSAERLEAMGLAREEADVVAWHPTCTLTHQARLVSFLVELDGVGGRDAFARLAASAPDEAACRLHVETAQLVWTYHRERRAVETLRAADGIVTLEDVDGHIALPLRADYVPWSAQTQALVDALPATGGRSLWLSGALSERARRAFERRGIGVHERVLPRQPGEIDVVAVLAPRRAETSPEDDAGQAEEP